MNVQGRVASSPAKSSATRTAMPHQGKPSGACKCCKQRHVRVSQSANPCISIAPSDGSLYVQCDETRPSCHRCIKSNRVCPGYAEGLDLVLRDQNEVAKASVGRRQKAAQKTRLACKPSQSPSETSSRPSNGSSPSCSSSPSSAPDPRCLIPNPSYLAPSEEDYQLCLFTDTFVLYPHDGQADCGFIGLLPLMYSSVKLDAPLALCVTAIASALSAKFVYKMRDVEMPKVRQKYTKALTATRRALEHPVESLTDETLMAVCLLGLYESIVESFKGRVSSARHFDGAAALITQRQGRMSTDLAQRLLLGVRNSIVYRAVSHATPIDTTLPIWQDLDITPHNAATLLDRMSLEIPKLMVAASFTYAQTRGDLECTFSRDTVGQDKVTIVAKAHSIDAELSAWPSTTPPTWAPVRVSINDIPTSIKVNGFIYQDYCEVFPDVMVATTWNSYRRSRLKALAVIAQLSCPASSQQSSTVEQIQDLADGICASVPFCLGSRSRPAPLYSTEADYPTIDEAPAKEHHHRTAVAFGAWYLFGPMKEVMSVGSWLRPGQMAWMRTQLLRLAKIYDVEPEED